MTGPDAQITVNSSCKLLTNVDNMAMNMKSYKLYIHGKHPRFDSRHGKIHEILMVNATHQAWSCSTKHKLGCIGKDLEGTHAAVTFFQLVSKSLQEHTRTHNSRSQPS